MEKIKVTIGTHYTTYIPEMWLLGRCQMLSRTTGLNPQECVARAIRQWVEQEEMEKSAERQRGFC